MEKSSKAGFGLVYSAVGAVTLAAALALPAPAMTVRTKSDLRLWQTVTERSVPLTWGWEPNADSATLTFSNRLTRAVSSVTVVRAAGATRGVCPHPVLPAADEGLVVVTLSQMSGGAELLRKTAEVAYVPGTVASAPPPGRLAGNAAISTKPIVVRVKGTPDWQCVVSPRLSAFDAAWWGLAGPSGHEVLWSNEPGYRRVTRTFGDLTVAEAILKFGVPGAIWFIR